MNRIQPKILLIDTPFNLFSKDSPPRIYLSMAIMYLATALKRSGYEPVIYDPKVSAKKNRMRGIYYVGDTAHEIEKRIRKEKPDIVGVTNLFSKDFNNAVMLCKLTKKVDKKIITIVGGPHATALPNDFLSEDVVDMVAIGEGEETIVELMHHLQGHRKLSEIKGIAYKNNHGTVVFNDKRPNVEKMDSLGYPDYDLIDLETYFAINAKGLGSRPLGVGKRSFSVSTSRGCPYQCFFCAARNVAGVRFRAYSADKVIEHITDLSQHYAIDSFYFEDDNLSFDKERFKQILDGLLKLPSKIKWATPNGVRADTLLDKRLIRKIKKSGCQYLTVGVESGNQEFLSKVINKSLDLRVIVKLAKMCTEVDLPLNAFFIIGFPDEKLSQIKDTLNFAFEMHQKYNMFPYINFAIPIKGTKMYDICKEKDYLVEDITYKSLAQSSNFRGAGKISTPEFTPELLSTLMKDFNRKIFYASIWKAAKSPNIALRYTSLALQNFSHFRRHILGW